MPWRLVIFILIGVVCLAFTGLNLENRCDISFGFGITFSQVPVFLTAFSAFVLGMLLALPLAVSFRSKRRLGRKPGKKSSPAPGAGGGPEPVIE
ncbi:MAG: hypothetical protein LBQ46_08490 [Treponema sp.]|jgi:uncharacterized integral membrane protein|nr:hypothetical protein [Treponema sp.]